MAPCEIVVINLAGSRKITNVVNKVLKKEEKKKIDFGLYIVKHGFLKVSK